MWEAIQEVALEHVTIVRHLKREIWPGVDVIKTFCRKLRKLDFPLDKNMLLYKQETTVLESA